MPAGPLSKQVSGLILKMRGYIYSDLSKQPGSDVIGIKPELLVVHQAHVTPHLPPKHFIIYSKYSFNAINLTQDYLLYHLDIKS